jgi:uncharacterized protein (DUF2235 family)
MGRHLISLIDGTLVSASQATEYQGYSNVYELAYMLQLKDRSEDDRPQIVFYTSGISSQPGTRDLFSAATGYSIRAQILDQYTNICSNYDFSLHDDEQRRDKIYLFGFSRGAMAARALAGLIMEFGLLKPEHIRYAPKIVADWENNEDTPSIVDLVEVDVEFVGVFDSVMGGIPSMKMFNPINFPNDRLSGRCCHGIHILAIDEDRLFFQNRSWERHDRSSETTQMKQIWMPGVHSDIGGTGGEFWGRASFLAMTYYIDTLTDLRLDRSWLTKKERNLKSDWKKKSYRIRQHRPPILFRTRRRPDLTVEANEIRHPVIDLIAEKFRYNGRDDYAWKQSTLAKDFSGLSEDPGLTEYFEQILSSKPK